MEMLVKLEGVPEELVLLMMEEGYFKTKTELVRAGILELGKEYNLLKSPEELEAMLVAAKIKQMDEEVKKGEARLVPLKEVERLHRAKK